MSVLSASLASRVGVGAGVKFFKKNSQARPAMRSKALVTEASLQFLAEVTTISLLFVFVAFSPNMSLVICGVATGAVVPSAGAAAKEIHINMYIF